MAVGPTRRGDLSSAAHFFGWARPAEPSGSVASQPRIYVAPGRTAPLRRGIASALPRSEWLTDASRPASHDPPKDKPAAAPWAVRSDERLVAVDNKIDPGGTTGWHEHPGPSLILVVLGQVTN